MTTTPPMALSVTGATKHYDSGFTLEDVTFDLPAGYIMGLIGPNGAGKSTLIKLILNMIRRDAGRIQVLGLDAVGDEEAVKEQLGVVFDTSYFVDTWSVDKVERVMRGMYRTWRHEAFDGHLRRFGLDRGKKVKELSRGMGMKLSLACALSHRARLLILDEATAGLDPMARDEVLDRLRDFVAEPGRAVLMSSHITSDLERIADRIVCIEAGRIVFDLPKDAITDEMGIARCRVADLERVAASGVIPERDLRYLRHDYGIDLLVPDRFAFAESFPEIPVDRMTIDDYLALTLKGGVR